MARSASRAPVVAIFGAVAYAIFAQLELSAFVSPHFSLGTSSQRSDSPVILAASKAEIAEAEKQAKLLTWAYETAVAKGLPQAAMMKGKADQAVATLAALKEGGSAPSFSAPAAPVAAPAPVAAAPAMAAAPSGASKAEIAEAEKQAKLLTWAYETAAAKGMPQAAAAKARADQAVAKVQALKAQAEGGPAPSFSTPSAPVSSPPVAAPAVAAAAPSGASKAEIAEAEKQAKLLVWAAETAAAKGMPQAASAKARADQAVAQVQALKAQAQGSPAPVPVPSAPVAAPAPAVAAPAVAAAAPSGASKAEIAEAEKQAKLLTWAYETAVAKGMPQAAMMKAKADQAVAALEAMKAQKQMAMR